MEQLQAQCTTDHLFKDDLNKYNYVEGSIIPFYVLFRVKTSLISESLVWKMSGGLWSKVFISAWTSTNQAAHYNEPSSFYRLREQISHNSPWAITHRWGVVLESATRCRCSPRVNNQVNCSTSAQCSTHRASLQIDVQHVEAVSAALQPHAQERAVTWPEVLRAGSLSCDRPLLTLASFFYEAEDQATVVDTFNECRTREARPYCDGAKGERGGVVRPHGRRHGLLLQQRQRDHRAGRRLGG